MDILGMLKENTPEERKGNTPGGLRVLDLLGFSQEFQGETFPEAPTAFWCFGPFC